MASSNYFQAHCLSLFGSKIRKWIFFFLNNFCTTRKPCKRTPAVLQPPRIPFLLLPPHVQHHQRMMSSHLRSVTCQVDPTAVSSCQYTYAHGMPIYLKMLPGFSESPGPASPVPEGPSPRHCPSMDRLSAPSLFDSQPCCMLGCLCPESVNSFRPSVRQRREWGQEVAVRTLGQASW